MGETLSGASDNASGPLPDRPGAADGRGGAGGCGSGRRPGGRTVGGPLTGPEGRAAGRLVVRRRRPGAPPRRATAGALALGRPPAARRNGDGPRRRGRGPSRAPARTGAPGGSAVITRGRPDRGGAGCQRVRAAEAIADAKVETSV
ncbi:hypothetical protein B1H20_32600 [Streptomyces violaceoruber]|uniref:Uncharacterized protein n=1 Tax=Streptomyces violaceoruber TaxID=1935 RepID=A0A1V0UK54_STRVN|nr:hypothetical protein B1H20_32600 [Streptomyces violaceoruber]